MGGLIDSSSSSCARSATDIGYYKPPILSALGLSDEVNSCSDVMVCSDPVEIVRVLCRIQFTIQTACI